MRAPPVPKLRPAYAGDHLTVGRRRALHAPRRLLPHVAAMLAALALLALSASSARAEATIDQFSTGVAPGAEPAAATFDGAVWFGELAPGGVLGRIAPDGSVTNVPAAGDVPDADPTGMASSGGSLYVAADCGLYRVGADGTFVRLSAGLRPDACVFDLAAAPDGSVWFTDDGGDGAIGQIAPDGTIVERNAGLTPQSDPHGIAAAPDGSVWFTELRGAGLGRAAPDGTISEFAGAHGTPLQIVAGPDGAMWFTEYDHLDAIGRVTATGAVTEFPVSGVPLGIAAGDDGRLYFTEPFGPQAIGAITVDGQVVPSLAPTVSLCMPWSIVPGPDGNMWFTQLGPPGSIGRLTTPPGIGAGSPAPAGVGGAALSAVLRTHGQDSTYSFQYGSSASYGQQTPQGTAAGADAQTGVEATVSGLQPGVTYHYRLVATNASGTTLGPDQTVVAGASVAPDLATGAASAPQAGQPAAQTSSLSTPPEPAAGASSTGPLRLAPRLSPGGPNGGLTRAPVQPLRSSAIRQGRTVGLGAIGGVIYVRTPHSRHRLRLGAGELLPVGTLVDARKGIVTLTAAQGGGTARSAAAPGSFGASAAATGLAAVDLSGGMFVVAQSPRDGGAVAIELRGGSFAGCVNASRATRSVHRRRSRRARARSRRRARARRHSSTHRRRPARRRRRNARVVRQLWSKDSGGNFSTHGRDSVGTVQGTLWLTQDRCDGTLTRVIEGTVSVKPLHRRGHVLVHHGHHYLAPAA